MATAPAGQRPILEHLRKKIRRHLPLTLEGMSEHNFPIYTLDEEWIAGFAARKQGPMFYVMVQEVLNEHDATLGRLRTVALASTGMPRARSASSQSRPSPIRS